MRKERNFGLDLLRAIAITLVVVSHCTYLFVQDSDQAIVLIIRTLGAVGVDLFFVLSGFLIGGLLLKEIENKRTKFSNLITFWKRRWLRTLPNYYLLLLLNIGVFFVFSKALPDQIGSYFVFLHNFSGPQPPFFTESWSLSIEEYAYLILPFLIFIGLLLFKKDGKKVFLWTTLAVIAIGFFLKLQFYYQDNVYSYKDWSALYRKVVIYRLDSIYFGFLLVYFMRQWSDFFKNWRVVFLILGTVIFTGTHLLIYGLNLQPQTDLEFFVFMYLPLISISCGMVFPFTIHMKPLFSVSELVYFVSTRSYAIYLTNFSAILMSILFVFDLEAASVLMQISLCVLYLAITVGFSNLVFIYFEKPILNYRDKNLR